MEKKNRPAMKKVLNWRGTAVQLFVTAMEMVIQFPAQKPGFFLIILRTGGHAAC